MAITLSAEFSATTAGSTNYNVTGVTAAAGTMGVALCHIKTAATDPLSGIIDSGGNTWTYRTSTYMSGSGTRIEIWTATITTALSGANVTIQHSNTNVGRTSLSIWNGAANPIIVDDIQSLGQAATTTPASVTVTTSDALAVIIGGISYNNATRYTTGPGGSWTTLSEGSPSAGFYGSAAYLIPGATGTYGPSWTLATSSSSGEATIALKADTGMAGIAWYY